MNNDAYADINDETTDEVLATSSSTNIESPLLITTMDTNVNSIDRVVSSNEIEDGQVLQSSNYGTFSDVAQEHDEVHIAVSADEQPTTTAADEFENEDMQPHQQQQTPVLIDIEEEVIQHSPDHDQIGRAQQSRRKYILLTALLLLLATVATTLGILLGRNNRSSSGSTSLGASMNNNDI